MAKRRLTFPLNTKFTLARADEIVQFICTYGYGQSNRWACRFGLTREEMAGFIERNAEMLPPRGAA